MATTKKTKTTKKAAAKKPKTTKTPKKPKFAELPDDRPGPSETEQEFLERMAAAGNADAIEAWGKSNLTDADREPAKPKAQKSKKSKTKKSESTVDVEALTKMATDLKLPVKVQSSFVKIGKGPRRVYVARSGKRIDLSGFSFSGKAVTEFTEEEAKQRKLGRVRAQIDPTVDGWLDSLKKALGMLEVV